MYPRRSNCVVFVALVIVSGCFATHTAPSTPSAPLGTLSISCNPTDAWIFLDDRFMGVVSQKKAQPLRIPRGKRRLELRHEDYFPHYTEIEVGTTPRRVSVELEKRPFRLRPGY